jgi:ABC-type multidrug transport system ATPase subunit
MGCVIGTENVAGRASSLVVETTGLSKEYAGGRLAVDGLDLRVRRGEVYGFLGPNGAGKTTTLRMLVGLMRPTSGTAVVAGHKPGTRESLARIGALIEAPAFYPYLSGRDNLRVLAAYCGIPSRRVDDALEQVAMTRRASGKFATYSLGMKQRLGVAATLLKDPELLVLDEPTNGLDPAGMVEMRELVRALGAGGRTVLLSTHLLGEVEHICTRVGVIQQGRLVAQGDLDELRGGSRLLVRALPLERARLHLEGMFGADAIRIEGDAIVVQRSPSQSGEIMNALIGAGLSVTEVRPYERSLEDVFLQLTAEAPVS